LYCIIEVQRAAGHRARLQGRREFSKGDQPDVSVEQECEIQPVEKPDTALLLDLPDHLYRTVRTASADPCLCFVRQKDNELVVVNVRKSFDGVAVGIPSVR